MKSENRPGSWGDAAGKPQVGALTIRFVDGAPQVLLTTSRETKRWIIPKGWPMKGKTNAEAAAIEAREETGVIGKPRKSAIGEFAYFKRSAARFELCRVEVYRLDYKKQLENFREKGQREIRWTPLNEAADLVDEPGLIAILRDLGAQDLAPPPAKTKNTLPPRSNA